MSLPFSDFYDVYGDEIRATAHSQSIPGLDYDDVVSEMLICLWKAANTYEYAEGTPFASYWWSLWLNRKYTLTRDFSREKRIQPVLVEDTQSLDRSVTDHHLPPAPLSADDQERLIWDLLAVGCNATEVQREAEVSKRTYYRTIQSWQTEAIHNMLI